MINNLGTMMLAIVGGGLGINGRWNWLWMIPNSPGWWPSPDSAYHIPYCLAYHIPNNDAYMCSSCAYNFPYYQAESQPKWNREFRHHSTIQHHQPGLATFVPTTATGDLLAISCANSPWRHRTYECWYVTQTLIRVCHVNHLDWRTIITNASITPSLTLLKKVGLWRMVTHTQGAWATPWSCWGITSTGTNSEC